MPIFSLGDTSMLDAEEVRFLRVRRQRRLLVGALAIVLLIGGLAGARPTIHAIKGWQSRRAAAEAMSLIDQERWPEAHKRAADAYTLGPAEPAALRAAGRALARTKTAGALNFYRQLEKLNKLTPEDRRDVAAISLSLGNTAEAAKQSAWLLAHPDSSGATAADLLLAAQVASARGDIAAAVDFSRKVLETRGAQDQQYFTAAVRLVNDAAQRGDPNGPQSALAWQQIRRLADSRESVGLDALTLLSRRPPPAADVPEPPGWMPHAAIAKALESHPLAGIAQRLLALDLTTASDPAAQRAAIDAAVARWHDADNATLAIFVPWLLGKGEAARAVDLLPAARVKGDAALFLARLEALAALSRWPEIKQTLEQDDGTLDSVSLHMYRAAAAGKIGGEGAGAFEWKLALEAAGGNPNKLYTLGQYAESQNAFSRAQQAYAAAIAAAPRMRPAYESLCRVTNFSGATAEENAVVSTMLDQWPQDIAAGDLKAYLSLLLGVSPDEAKEMERKAVERSAQRPADWQLRATISLARLRQGRTTEALQAFSGLHASESAPPPGPLAVRAAALAAAGWKAEAAADAQSLKGAGLRPEEKAFIAPLLGN